ncbi:hypothetical protein A3A79_02420 [Candidatus Gottesmanbacteria bacterium RIFCSPLOWO2_01_FULL_43_11b]|uniref:Uncharacterized protein n=1 Tax=Candidatus Gottesmanbacteria bacterium RIFCSPLOWO2_01_FULL_43_11b TaxID=1798392 RepID=A0A1F6AGZ2_9BACT|nr:MAG: hypothetical protein A3A79_02420 [Candidatus Gottesmanbacteria bacterium RIFCSPLOWO2_01_FULL_43_11b]
MAQRNGTVLVNFLAELEDLHGRFFIGRRKEKNMNHEFQFVTAIHGNETMPHRALRQIGEKHVIGNPLALLLNRRFINLDLNASFGVRGVLYEQLRAPQVLKKLNSHGLVIDFHTFSCDSPPFAIVVDESMIPLASSLGVEHVVHMRHNIKKGHALINFRDGVSVEVGAHKDQRSFDLAQQIVMKLKNNGIKPQSVRVYEVFGKIEEPGNYQNFVRAQDGIIPVLYGEKAYIKQGFYGLIAREIILKGGDTHERAQ